jgi:putative ABC transport system permease protein
MVRFRSEDIALLSEGIRRQWDELFPGTPVELIFLDDSLDRLYRGVIRQGGLLRASSALAIAIACLGLLGLAAYAAERRRKEIAVRKVLGGSVRQLLGLLVREFVLLVLVANVIAWPLAWLLLERWLDEFAYRVPFGWDLLPFAGLIALLIALAVVTAQTLRAVHTNPADVLREE